MTAVAAVLTTITLSAQPNKASPHESQTSYYGHLVAVYASGINQHDDSGTYQGESGSDAQKWYATLEQPDWWLVILGFGTLAVVWWQTKQVRKAADAALLNAQAVINAERAWLVVKIQKDPNPHPFPAENFINVLTNEGRTPAVFRSVHIEHTFVSWPDDLPVPPVYGPRWLLNTEKTFFVGREGLPIGPSLDPNKVIYQHRRPTGIEDTQEFFVWYGRIVYEDVFGTQGETLDLHETRWCYAWIKGEKKFVRYGPEEYNRNT